ncbi:NADPH-dependent F420 reductase [Streptomyces pseudovenezuelae]|uniref:Dinucleotide-binding enzyme n=1 Tax=Streptomyces pseudovenezuelae TaxID=67350 RepID=A0ABT6LKR2_9ACTN|nr:putative dinucleotide-binding enzyme [Streptomyces pseudovenezuelae]
MRIGIVGSGEIGATVAGLFVRAGHEVAVSNTRGPASLAALVSELGPRARAATVEDAVAFGDPVVVLAIPFNGYRTLPADLLTGKVLVDTTNYVPGRDGADEALQSGALTSSERIAEHAKSARVVKAVNTLNYTYLLDRGRPGAARKDRTALFVAGDDREAVRIVAGLIDEIGFAPVETGSLAEGGRRQQMDSPVFNRPLKYGQLRLAD